MKLQVIKKIHFNTNIYYNLLIIYYKCELFLFKK